MEQLQKDKQNLEDKVRDLEGVKEELIQEKENKLVARHVSFCVHHCICISVNEINVVCNVFKLPCFMSIFNYSQLTILNVSICERFIEFIVVQHDAFGTIPCTHNGFKFMPFMITGSGVAILLKPAIIGYFSQAYVEETIETIQKLLNNFYRT